MKRYVLDQTDLAVLETACKEPFGENGELPVTLQSYFKHLEKTHGKKAMIQMYHLQEAYTRTRAKLDYEKRLRQGEYNETLMALGNAKKN